MHNKKVSLFTNTLKLLLQLLLLSVIWNYCSAMYLKDRLIGWEINAAFQPKIGYIRDKIKVLSLI